MYKKLTPFLLLFLSVTCFVQTAFAQYPDIPADVILEDGALDNAKTILENRANALGVSEVVMQTAGDRRIVAEFPGVTNPEEVVASLKRTALLEFVDMGATPVTAGSAIQTDFGLQNAAAPTPAADGTQPTVYHTVMTGAGLESAVVTAGQRAGQ